MCGELYSLLQKHWRKANMAKKIILLVLLCDIKNGEGNNTV